MAARRSLQSLVVLLVALTLGACAQAQPESAATCPEPSAGNQRLVNEEAGYCLIYPEGFAEAGTPLNLWLASGPNDPGPLLPFATIDVTPAGGLNTQAAAEQLAGDLPFEVPQSPVTIGGVEAVRLDRVPGQDLLRQLIVVHEDQRYLFTFVPDDPQAGDAYQRMEMLYQTVLNSFQFLP